MSNYCFVVVEGGKGGERREKLAILLRIKDYVALKRKEPMK